MKQVYMQQLVLQIQNELFVNVIRNIRNNTISPEYGNALIKDFSVMRYVASEADLLFTLHELGKTYLEVKEVYKKYTNNYILSEAPHIYHSHPTMIFTPS